MTTQHEYDEIQQTIATPFQRFIKSININDIQYSDLEKAFMAGCKSTRNYVADYEVCPTKVTFTNGRSVYIVHEDGHFFLEVK